MQQSANSQSPHNQPTFSPTLPFNKTLLGDEILQNLYVHPTQYHNNTHLANPTIQQAPHSLLQSIYTHQRALSIC
ncbi:hypothetical protein QQG55_26425 [Brugia pahangi]